jgi:hypothetical protein
MCLIFQERVHKLKPCLTEDCKETFYFDGIACWGAYTVVFHVACLVKPITGFAYTLRMTNS